MTLEQVNEALKLRQSKAESSTEEKDRPLEVDARLSRAAEAPIKAESEDHHNCNTPFFCSCVKQFVHDRCWRRAAP
jgi:hypothetical protein